MNQLSYILHLFVWLLIIILTIILFYSSAEFLVLVVRTMLNRTAAFDFSTPAINTENLFLVKVQGLIGGVLLLTIIVELIQTLLTSLRKDKNHLYLVILFEIAIIAVIRHLFIYEFDHMNGVTIIGIAFLILVLGVMNLLYRKPETLNKILNKKSQTTTDSK